MYNDSIIMEDSTNSLFGQNMLVFTIMTFVLLIFYIICFWKIYKKLGIPGWKSLIPIYSYIVLFKAVDMSAINTLLLFIPIVNIYVLIKLLLKICRKFDKKGGFVVGLIFLPFIFIPILAFSKIKAEENIDINEEDVKSVYCPKCNIKLALNAKKCYVCGTEVSNVEEVGPVESVTNDSNTFDNSLTQSSDVTADSFDMTGDSVSTTPIEVSLESDNVSIPEFEEKKEVDVLDFNEDVVPPSTQSGFENVEAIPIYNNDQVIPKGKFINFENNLDVVSNNSSPAELSAIETEKTNENVDSLFNFSFDETAGNNITEDIVSPPIDDLNKTNTQEIINNEESEIINFDTDILEQTSSDMNFEKDAEQQSDEIEIIDFGELETTNDVIQSCPTCGSKVIANSMNCVICGSKLN